MRRLLSLSAFVISLTILLVSASPDTIQVRDVWISETPPGVSKNAAYLLIENPGIEYVVLQSVDSPDFERVEIHRSMVSDGQVRMQLQSHVEIEANTVFQFSPGNYHLMLINPLRKMQAGDMSILNFNFLNAAKISVNAEVRKLQLDHVHHH
jgi:copper(I)-binding protein